MRILADENIPYAREAFARFGEVETMPGRAMTRSHLDGVDVLLVRSVTTVDESLLADTSVSFVGSATSGLDHVDLEFVESKGIPFAHAVGANARSVAEYVVAAILENVDDLDSLASKRCGIIGFGHVGQAVYRLLSVLGVQCVAVDPFVARPEAGPDLVSLRDVLDCDILTFHVPYTDSGEHPTQQMINANLLASIRNGALLVNASRGGVLDAGGWIHAKRNRPSLRIVLDVYDHEPRIDVQLAESSVFATPHIAGYSWDAKIEGTRRLFDALNYWKNTTHRFPDIADAPTVPRLRPPEAIGSVTAEIRHAVRQVYDIRTDARALREGIADEQIMGEGNIGRVFDRLRKSYGPRREFTAARATPKGWSSGACAMLRGLGFVME